MSAIEDLKKRRDQLITEAKGIAEAAKKDGRDLLKAEEQHEIGEMLTEIKGINETLAADAKSANIFAQLDAMAAGNTDITPGGEPFDGASGAKQFLSFSKGWSDQLAAKTQLYGEKAIAAGSSVFIDAELTTTPIPIGRPATALLNVLPVTRHGQPAYSYLRQSVRNNQAAVVAEGATKPTSVYTIVKVDGALSVIAHLSEPVPRYWFEDRAELQQFINDEMSYGLQLAVESKALADINGTSGIQTQTYDTSKLVTIRKSLTKVEVQGYTPSAIVVHPMDWEEIELLLVTSRSSRAQRTSLRPGHPPALGNTGRGRQHRSPRRRAHPRQWRSRHRHRHGRRPHAVVRNLERHGLRREQGPCSHGRPIRHFGVPTARRREGDAGRSLMSTQTGGEVRTTRTSPPADSCPGVGACADCAALLDLASRYVLAPIAVFSEVKSVV